MTNATVKYQKWNVHVRLAKLFSLKKYSSEDVFICLISTQKYIRENYTRTCVLSKRKQMISTECYFSWQFPILIRKAVLGENHEFFSHTHTGNAVADPCFYWNRLVQHPKQRTFIDFLMQNSSTISQIERNKLIFQHLNMSFPTSQQTTGN